MKINQRFLVALVPAFLIVCGLAYLAYSYNVAALPDDVGVLLVEARKAKFTHDLERERLLLEHAENLEGPVEDLAEVQRLLALLDWKFLGKFEAARDRLIRAAEGAEPADAWLAMARMEQAREAFPAAREAVERAAIEEETRRSRLALARASVGEAVQLRLGGRVADSDHLRLAFDELHREVRNEAGVLEPSRLLLQAALLLDRGEIAILAWRSYFHVPPGQPMPNAVAGAGERLLDVLSGWKGADASSKERIDLIKALAGSRLFREAVLIARDPRAPATVSEDRQVREAVAYAGALQEVRKITEEYYRKTTLGNGDPGEFEDRIEAVGNLMARQLEGVKPDKLPSEDLWKKLLDERFGVFVSLDETAGYFDLHMGHRVIDETRTVEQYGHRARLRFVALDNMVSNGFQSWAWEGNSQHGGWADADTIWQVRPAYANGPIESWRKIHSEEERKEFEDEMARETDLDDRRAAENPFAFLPGLSMRVKYQGITRLLDDIRSRGITGEELRLAFIVALEKAVQDSSIFAHEGRHAIEKHRDSIYQSGWRAEFSAKLSEVAFAPQPRLAFGGILTVTIGDSTPHGQANLKIMKGLVSWMEEHRNEIAGLDPDLPLLPQFDLLTDGQMRAAIRSMDPLAER